MICPNCGASNNDDVTFCAFCGSAMNAEAAAQSFAPQQQEQPTFPQQQDQSTVPNAPSMFSQQPISVAPVKANVGMGILGAVLFSLIGCAVWVLIGSLGYISYLGGLVLSFLTITGYKLLGKKFDITGVIICAVVVALAVFVSNIFTEALLISMDADYMEALHYLGYNGFGDVFFRFFELIKKMDTLIEVSGVSGKNMSQAFISNLLFGYLFAGIAFIVMAISQFKVSKNK